MIRGQLGGSLVTGARSRASRGEKTLFRTRLGSPGWIGVRAVGFSRGICLESALSPWIAAVDSTLIKYALASLPNSPPSDLAPEPELGQGQGQGTAPSQTSRAFCVFRSGGVDFAVDLESVVEVFEAERLIRLPLKAPGVLGLCSIRREVIPVVSLRPTTEPPHPQGATQSVLVLSAGPNILWGIAVQRADTAVIETQPDERGSEPTGEGPGARGWVRRGDSLHTLLDPTQTWRELRASIERWHGLAEVATQVDAAVTNPAPGKSG